MPSGKQAKAARRAARTAPPPVQSKGSPRRARQASPRTLAIGGGVVAVIIVVVVLAVALSGGKSSGVPKNVQTVGSIATGLPGAADVNAMYKGIPQRGDTLGSSFAPAEMIEYIDLQCPVCDAFETQQMPAILQKYVRTGKLRIIARPVFFIGPDSQRGRSAMLAAEQQNKGFNYSQILYDNQATENTGWLNDNMVYQAAISIPGLNVPKFLAARNSAVVHTQESDIDAAVAANKINATPTIYVQHSGTKPTVAAVGLPTQSKLFAQIDAAIAG
jgi:protein-disulfide isomerase